jgi:SAM-dependent methyltransferase
MIPLFYHRWVRFLWPFNRIVKKEYANVRLLAGLMTQKEGIGLDIGCGVGHSFQLMTTTKTIGLDKDRKMARLVRKTCRTPLVIADAVLLPFREGSLCAVNAIGLTEYLSDLKVFLKEIEHVGTEDCEVILTSSPFTLFSRLRRLLSPSVHIRTSDELCRLAACCHLIPVEVLHTFSQDALLLRRKIVAETDL